MLIAGLTRRTISSSTVSASPTHRCLAAVDPDDLGLRHRGEPLPRLLRAQVVVELGNQRDAPACPTRPSASGPAAVGVAQRRREQDRARDRRVAAVLAAPGRCRTTSRPARSRAARRTRRTRSRRPRRTARRRRVVEAPSLVPRTLVVPRVLKRSTARSASAGSRQAALRNTWLSIMPPWVGSGCRQTRVADRVPVGRQRQLTDQGQPVGGVQLDVLRGGPGRTALARIGCSAGLSRRRGPPGGT